jgi:hypothetical protein
MKITRRVLAVGMLTPAVLFAAPAAGDGPP